MAYSPPLTITPRLITLVSEISELMQRLGLSHRATFSQNYLKPALAAGVLVMTHPDSPRSPTQRYRRVR